MRAAFTFRLVVLFVQYTKTTDLQLEIIFCF